MGIKGLWTVLTPFGEKKSLHEIRGETIAVDLSGWVCDSQNVADYHVQPRLYLRNLFFRTLYLILAEVTPIFVLEGDAPELKRDVMAARNAIQFKGAAPKTDGRKRNKPNVTRRNFRAVLRECESLLKCMGVSCIKGAGEAEATCALLNAQGLVDAVVSQDSDCFAYGARRVYKNFSVSNSAGGGALQGSIDCYDATKMFEHNGFGRNKMVALALLCGCDYGAGACGSSIGTAVAFLHTVQDVHVIPRLLSWVSDPSEYEEKQRWVSAPGRCDRCGHAGRSHGKGGCPTCATDKGCDDTGHKTLVSNVKRELSLRARAVNCGSQFPEPMVMKEFLNRPAEVVDLEALKISAPSLIQFVKVMRSKLDWTERYCVEKFLPVLTRWHLQDTVPATTIKPVLIKKKRNPRGVPRYEVVWSDVNGQYDGLIPDEQFDEEEDPCVAWTTTERQDLIKTYYPELVEAYEESIKKPPKEKKPRIRKNKDTTDKPKRKYIKKKNNVSETNVQLLSDSISKMNISCNKESKVNISVKVNKLKRKRKVNPNVSKSQKNIDAFFSKRSKSMKKLMKSLRDSLSNISLKTKMDSEKIVEVNKENIDSKSVRNNYSILDLSDDEVEENELSYIVDKIVNTAPVSKTASVNNNLVRLVFGKQHTPRKSGFRKSVLNEVNYQCSTPNNSPLKKKNTNANTSNTKPNMNTSHFFDKLTDVCDAFELSIDYNVDFDVDKTVEYSYSELV